MEHLSEVPGFSKQQVTVFSFKWKSVLHLDDWTIVSAISSLSWKTFKTKLEFVVA